MMLIAMKRFEQLLPVHQFIRIHKSYIVSLDFITEFDRATVYLREKKLPVGSQFKGVVERSVVIVQHEHSDDVIPINYVERRVHAG
jgi:DNA-binding LytR/AlgR family response regulator